MSFFFSASNLPFWAPPSPVLRARVGWWWWGLLRTLPPGPAPAGVSPASPSDPRGSLRAAAGTKSPPSLRNFGVWTASCLAKAPHRLPSLPYTCQVSAGGRALSRAPIILGSILPDHPGVLRTPVLSRDPPFSSSSPRSQALPLPSVPCTVAPQSGPWTPTGPAPVTPRVPCLPGRVVCSHWQVCLPGCGASLFQPLNVQIGVGGLRKKRQGGRREME